MRLPYFARKQRWTYTNGDGNDLGNFVTGELLSIDWPQKMAIDVQGRKRFCYFVTESRDGFLPYSRAVESGILPTQGAIRNFLQNAFNVLTYFYHNYGFVHWDLHSENILCNVAGEVMLYDFDWATVMWNEVGGVKYTLSTYFNPSYQLVYASEFINEHILGNQLLYTNMRGIHQDQVLVHKVGHMYDLFRLFYDGRSAVHLTTQMGQRMSTINLVIFINMIIKRYYAPMAQFPEILESDVMLTGASRGRLDTLIHNFEIHKNIQINDWFIMFLHSWLIFRRYRDYFTPTYLSIMNI